MINDVMPSLIDLTDELSILNSFLNRYGFTETNIRLSICEGNWSLVSGKDATNVPDQTGYWSDALLLSADASEASLREIAATLRAQVSDSYLMQTSYWGQGTGVVAIPTDRVKELRMAN